MKTCYLCKTEKPLDQFVLRAGSKDGHGGYCLDCQNAKSRAWYASNPGRRVEYRKQRREKTAHEYRAWKYGISQEEYEGRMAVQMNVCGICGEPNIQGRPLAVDHDHDSNEVRGLLCNNCNLGLGYFKDNPRYMERAISYLELGSVQ